MNSISEICSAVKRIAWGFFFIFIHINIGSVDILPDWVGYAMIVSALGAVISEADKLKVLRPVGVILVVWNVLEWVLDIFGAGAYAAYVAVIPAVLAICLVYTLFKNLAVCACKYTCPQEKSLNLLAAVYAVFNIVSTVCSYISLIFSDVAAFMIIGVVLIVVGLSVMIAILVTLFAFSRTLKEKSEMPVYQTAYKSPECDIESQENT